jgi:hypothetical protein
MHLLLQTEALNIQLHAAARERHAEVGCNDGMYGADDTNAPDNSNITHE